jgi:hypothetical protein
MEEEEEPDVKWEEPDLEGWMEEEEEEEEGEGDGIRLVFIAIEVEEKEEEEEERLDGTDARSKDEKGVDEEDE